MINDSFGFPSSTSTLKLRLNRSKPIPLLDFDSNLRLTTNDPLLNFKNQHKDPPEFPFPKGCPRKFHADNCHKALPPQKDSAVVFRGPQKCWRKRFKRRLQIIIADDHQIVRMGLFAIFAKEADLKSSERRKTELKRCALRGNSNPMFLSF